MLKSVRIQNFKSYKDATLALSPFTVLIGANASGKSNAIEALRFLSILANGQKLSSFKYAVLNKDGGIRGSIDRLMYPESKSCFFGCEFDTSDYNALLMEISLKGSELFIASESLAKKGKKTPLYIATTREGGFNFPVVNVTYDNFTRGGKYPSIACSNQEPVFMQLTTPASILEKYKVSRSVIPENSRKVQAALKSFFFLDPIPAKMRGYSAPDKLLLNNGENLSGVLFNLIKQTQNLSQEEKKENRKNKEDILAFIESLPEQNFSSVSTIKEPRGERLLTLKETFGNNEQECDASLLSDGTLRVLAVAVALLSAPEKSTVVIEELDNGIHPSRAKQILAKVNEIAKRRNLKILITTHNPAMLDALPPEVIPDCVFCYRDPKDGSSKLMKLSDAPNYMDLLIQDSLGGLLTSQKLDSFIKRNESSDERKNKSLKWLNELLSR